MYFSAFRNPPHTYNYTYVAGGCFSTGVGAAVGGFIGGVLLTGAIAGVVAVAVFCRVKRELTVMSRCVSKSYQHIPHMVRTHIAPHKSVSPHNTTHTPACIYPLMHSYRYSIHLVRCMLCIYYISDMNQPTL